MTTNERPMQLTLCETGDTKLEGFESYSPFCLKVHRALKFAGLNYARKYGRPDSFKSVNPVGQVPVLLIGDEAVSDSSNIVRRIDSISGGKLTQGNASEAWLWEEFADTSLNGFLVASRWADDRNWDRVADAYFGQMPAAIRWFVPNMLRKKMLKTLIARDVWRAGPDACWERFQRLLDQLDARSPRSGFWIGENLTVADLALFGQLQSFRTDLTVWQRDQVAKRAALASYLDRVDAATRQVSQVQNHAPSVSRLLASA